MYIYTLPISKSESRSILKSMMMIAEIGYMDLKNSQLGIKSMLELPFITEETRLILTSIYNDLTPINAYQLLSEAENVVKKDKERWAQQKSSNIVHYHNYISAGWGNLWNGIKQHHTIAGLVCCTINPMLGIIIVSASYLNSFDEKNIKSDTDNDMNNS